MNSSPDGTELSESYLHLSSDHSSHFDSSENLTQSPNNTVSSVLLSRARNMDRLFAAHSPQTLQSPYHGAHELTYPETSFSSHSTPLNIEPRAPSSTDSPIEPSPGSTNCPNQTQRQSQSIRSQSHSIRRQNQNPSPGNQSQNLRNKNQSQSSRDSGHVRDTIHVRNSIHLRDNHFRDSDNLRKTGVTGEVDGDTGVTGATGDTGGHVRDNHIQSHRKHVTRAEMESRTRSKSTRARPDPRDLVHKLVSHFEDALGECFQEFHRASDSSSDSADDTFDQNKTELLSPLSSPQSSREYDQKNEKTKTFDFFDPETAHKDEPYKNQSFNQSYQDEGSKNGSDGFESDSKTALSATPPPRLSLEDLTTDHIDIPTKNDAPRPSSADYVEALEEKVRQYQRHNEELHNELQFARSQLHHQEKHQSRNSVKTQEPVKASEYADLPDQFKPYYHKLHLDAVDEMNPDEMRRLIKNVMLSLLISDFEHLPTMVPKIGKYISLSTEFLDTLHGLLYVSSMKPSEYLRDYNLSLDGLSDCLEGMLGEIAPGSRPQSEAFI